MIVKCISNAKGDLPESVSQALSGPHSYDNWSCVVGTEYTVYGLSLTRGVLCYELCTRDDDSYPTWYPADLFSLADARLHPEMRLVYERPYPIGDPIAMVVHRRWADDPYFYDRLTDGDPDAQAIWRGIKEDIDGWR
jgi:hypothetical protein